MPEINYMHGVFVCPFPASLGVRHWCLKYKALPVCPLKSEASLDLVAHAFSPRVKRQQQSSVSEDSLADAGSSSPPRLCNISRKKKKRSGTKGQSLPITLYCLEENSPYLPVLN